MPTTRVRRAAFAILLAAALWACTYRLGAMALLDDPNEAEYAEVAREMVESGHWMSPQLNGVLFLNKPPLAYWLVGAADRAFGINEFAARLPSGLAMLLVVGLVAWLGGVLFDAETGWLAGAILLATGSTFVESHLVRPDLWLVVGITGSLVALAYLSTPAADGAAKDARQRRWPLLAWQISLAIGLLAKGMLALLIPGAVCLVLVRSERRVDLLRRLLHPRAWWLLAVLVLPWHAAMSLRHPGFLWDYVINQHLLFFFDRKLPRDSVPVSLPMFWEAFGLRLFPWTIFAPLAIAKAWFGRRCGAEARGDRLLLAWAGAVLLFFSLAGSRMEHYSMPAIPALALLLARLFRDAGGARGDAWARVRDAHVVGCALLALAAPILVPRLVASDAWLAPIGDVAGVARTVFSIFAAGAALAAGAVLLGRRAAVVPLLMATSLVLVPFVHQGLTLMTHIDSSAPLAAAVQAFADPTDRIVLESPVEYQSCAGFNFYLRRRLDLIYPPAFTAAPTYLQPHLDRLFVSRERFEDLWASDARVFLITDPSRPTARLEGSVPQPFYIVAHDHARWVITNRRFH